MYWLLWRAKKNDAIIFLMIFSWSPSSLTWMKTARKKSQVRVRIVLLKKNLNGRLNFHQCSLVKADGLLRQYIFLLFLSKAGALHNLFLLWIYFFVWDENTLIHYFSYPFFPQTSIIWTVVWRWWFGLGLCMSYFFYFLFPSFLP